MEPGLAFAAATRSLADWKGSDGWATSTFGTLPIKATVSNSDKIGVKLGFLEAVLIALAIVTTNKVWPSGGALATWRAAISLPAPGRFSTTTFCFSRSDKALAKMRGPTSVELPGGKPTTMRIG